MRRVKIKKLTTISWLTSKKLTDFLDFSLVNLKYGWKLLKFSKNSSSFSSLSFQIKKMSSIYLSHTKGFTFCVSRKLISTLSMKIHAYGGANLVPMAIPEICCLTFEPNSKKLFLSKSSAISNKSANFLSDLSFNFSYSALTPASCGILGYKPTTSAVTKNASSGILPRL